MKRANLAQRKAALLKADRALERAIDKRHAADTARVNGQWPVAKREAAALDRAEGAAHEAVTDALLALSRYIPRTPEELSDYILTVLPHWRVKDPSFEDERDRECLCDVLASITTAASAIIFKQASAYFTGRQR